MRIHTILFSVLICVSVAQAQRRSVPYSENFDSTVVPALPAGWETTIARSAGGDFTTTKSVPFTDSNAVICTNATVGQALTTPFIDFTDKAADSLVFYERRSSTHNSGLVVEASRDGVTFDTSISETLSNVGTTSYIRRAVKLPSLLDGLPQVRIRWRILGNGTGSTGTIRFDNVSITGLGQIDASVSEISFVPSFPSAGDTVNISASITNAGTQPLQNIPVEFYEDRNGDSLPQLNELFSTTTVMSGVEPGAAVNVSAVIHDVTFGENVFIVQTVVPGDQNPINNVRHAVLTVGLAGGSVVINEVMYAPTAGEPEWVELYNAASTPVDLRSWKLSNRNSIIRYAVSLSSIPLLPDRYVVVVKDTALFRSIHVDSGVDIIQSSSLPTFLFNNSGDAVVLFDARGAVMDSVRYVPAWGGQHGSSLERIDASAGSNDSANWGSSDDSIKSTPGKPNYLSPLEYNLRVLGVSAQDHIAGASIQIVITIQNIGKRSAGGFSVALYEDGNADSIAQESELVRAIESSMNLQPGESTGIEFSWPTSQFGLKFLIATIDYAADLRLFDNVKVGAIRISYPARSLIVNEIMYAPRSGDAEYVELFNPNPYAVDVRDWLLADAAETTSSSVHKISSSSVIVDGGGFIVVAGDSGIFGRFSYLTESRYRVIVKRSGLSLNNDGDNVMISDLTRVLMDSVHYVAAWHNPEIDDPTGRSLERINPDFPSNDRRNWSTCANVLGGTPGKTNSLYAIAIPSEAAISFSPNPFSPDADGFEDITIIHYAVSAAAGLVRIRIYDAVGRLVRLLADGEPTGAQGEIIWDGLNDRGERVRMGIYIVLVEALDAEGGSIRTIKGVVVVAVKL